MKKLVIGVLSTALLIGGSFGICEAKYHGGNFKQQKNYSHSNQKMRKDAGYVIHRTAEVIYAAQRSIQSHRNNRGNRQEMRMAIAHQQRARELYMNGFYREAINHSLRARNLAFQVLESNRERPNREYYHDSREKEYSRNSPRDKDIDLKIDIKKVGDNFEISRFELDINN